MADVSNLSRDLTSIAVQTAGASTWSPLPKAPITAQQAQVLRAQGLIDLTIRSERSRRVMLVRRLQP